MGEGGPASAPTAKRYVRRKEERMGWISKILGAVPKDELGGLRLDIAGQFWEVEGKTDFSTLLQAVHSSLPPDSVLYFEGGSPNKEIIDFMAAHAIPERVHIAYGTIWPRPRVFHVPAQSENIKLLADLAKRCAEPELAVHFHVYRDKEILLEWHDAFSQPMPFAGSLGEDTVRQFATALGAKYKRERSSNKAL